MVKIQSLWPAHGYIYHLYGLDWIRGNTSDLQCPMRRGTSAGPDPEYGTNGNAQPAPSIGGVRLKEVPLDELEGSSFPGSSR